MQSDYTRRQLDEMLGAILAAYPGIVDEAVTRSLGIDNRIYREAGLTPIPLTENMALQGMIRAGIDQAAGEFRNLTQSTIQYSRRQFDRAIQEAVLQIQGGQSYQQAISAGIRTLTENGVEVIGYGRDRLGRPVRRYIDGQFRTCTLTSTNQIALRTSLENGAMMGCNIFEVSAHLGCRDSHIPLQGLRYMRIGSTPEYGNLYTDAGVGTVDGIGGINCRHNIYPVPDPDAPLANTAQHLRDLNNKTVTYNGQKISLYDATQKQRGFEQQVRHWKREDNAKAVAADLATNPETKAGLFAEANEAHGNMERAQAKLRNFVSQTGLRRSYFREAAGKQLIA